MSTFEWGVLGLAAIASSYLVAGLLYEIWHARQARKRANYVRNCKRVVEHARRRR